MTISWTRTIEDRLIRLESSQNRLHQKLTALAGTVARQEADLVPAPPAPIPAAATPVPAAAAPAAAPISGGQALAASGLGMWRPSVPYGTSGHGKHRILNRVQNLNQAVRSLSQSVQRLETMCHLLGQCLVVAVDPQPSHLGLLSRPGDDAPEPAEREPGSSAGHAPDLDAGGDAGAGDAGGLGALAGLLPLLTQQGSSGAGGESGETGAGGGNSLAALAPLLQVLLGRQGGGGARLAGLLNSPALYQLLRMAGR